MGELGVAEDFGAKFEVHCVEVIPGAAPDKAVALEDFHEFEGNAVGVFHFGKLIVVF